MKHKWIRSSAVFFFSHTWLPKHKMFTGFISEKLLYVIWHIKLVFKCRTNWVPLLCSNDNIVQFYLFSFIRPATDKCQFPGLTYALRLPQSSVGQDVTSCSGKCCFEVAQHWNWVNFFLSFRGFQQFQETKVNTVVSKMEKALCARKTVRLLLLSLISNIDDLSDIV